MPIKLFLILASLYVPLSAAFGSTATRTSPCSQSSLPQQSLSILSHHKHPWNDLSQAAVDENSSSIATFATSLALAGTIFVTSLGTTTVAPISANAVELSTGAIVIETSNQQGQSLLKAEVDLKGLLATLLKNRKSLASSLGHIASVTNEELSSPAWKAVTKEILQIEGDVAPEVKVIPPSNWQQAVKDGSKGKLSVLFNDEYITLSIDDKFSSAEDEVVIRAKGVKGIPLDSLNQPAQEVAKNSLQEAITGFKSFWDAPLALRYGQDLVNDAMPKDVVVSNGFAITVGATVFIAGTYGVSYSYYLDQIAQEEARAQEKRQLMAKKKAAAAKQNAEDKTIPNKVESEKAAAAKEKLEQEKTLSEKEYQASQKKIEKVEAEKAVAAAIVAEGKAKAAEEAVKAKAVKEQKQAEEKTTRENERTAAAEVKPLNRKQGILRRVLSRVKRLLKKLIRKQS